MRGRVYRLVPIAHLILVFAFPNVGHAQVNNLVAYKCLCGEACNQGYDGLTAVGEVLRVRGGTKGLYGCKSNLYDKSPDYVKSQVKKAWERSESSNLTRGSTHFENVKAFGKPYWAKYMQPTVKIKDHQFYKEVK